MLSECGLIVNVLADTRAKLEWVVLVLVLVLVVLMYQLISRLGLLYSYLAECFILFLFLFISFHFIYFISFIYFFHFIESIVPLGPDKISNSPSTWKLAN